MEFLKRNKFRLFIVFIAIMLLLGVYTIVKGAEEDISVISIGGKKWTTSNINDNEKLLKVLSRVTKYDETNLIEQIPVGLVAGYNIGWTGTSTNSLNWNGCIGCTFQNDWWTTMLCVEPTSTISTAESNIEINSIVFISPTKIKGFKDGGATIEKNISNTELTIMQQYLKQSYLAQSDLNEASNFRKNNTYKALADKIYSKLGSGYWATCSSLGGDATLPTLDTNEEYYGIFVYVGKKGAGQDRVIWHTIKKDKVKDVEVNLKFKKTDTSGNIIDSGTYGKASFTITAESNATIGTDKKSEVSKTSNDFDLKIYPKDITKSFKLKIKETSTPKSFLGLPSDGVTLTVKYDKDGKVTNIDAGANNSCFKFTDGNVGVIKVKNKTIPPLTMDITKKVDGGTPQGTFVFNVTYEQQGSTSKTNKITLGKTSSGIVWNGSDDWQPKNSNNVKVTIKEECNDENYEGAAKILIEYRYNSTNENWDVVSSNVASGNLTTSDHKTYKLTVKNHYNPPIRLRFYKKDITGSISLQGAKMKIAKTATGSNIKKITYNNAEYTNTSLELVSASSSNNGVFQKEAGYYTVFIRPEDSSKGYVKLDITELVSPTGYNLLRKDKKPVTMTVYFDKDGTVTEISVLEEYKRLIELNKIWTNSDGVKYGIIRIKNDPRIIKGTKLYKYDKTGKNAVQGATFTAEFNGVTYVKINGNKINATGNKVTVTGLVVSDSSGLIANIQEIEALENSDTVYMTVTETNSVSGFSILPEPVNLVFKYDKKDSSGGKWKLYEDTENNELPSEFFEVKNDELTLNIKDDYKLDKLTILKTDSLDGSKVQGVKFNVTLGNVKSVKGYSINSSGTTILTGVTTNANGNIELEDVVISDITKPITITMEETYAPEGYKKINGKVTVKLIRDGNAYKITEQSKDSTVLDSEFKVGNAKVEGNTVSIGINDIPALQELNLFKLDSQDNSNLTGAEFKVNFSNVESYYVDGQKKTDASTTVTVDEGKALIEKILLEDITEPATITLEETKAPIGYKKLVGKIYLTVKYTDAGYTIKATKDETITNEEFNTADVEIKDKKYANVTIKDIPVMNLGGIVWEDGQKGVKNVELPNGRKDEDTGIAGVQVTLYKEGENNPITKDMYGNELMTKTASAGDTLEYKMYNGQTDTITLEEGEYIFPNLERGTNYYVVFTYDGINYQTTKLSEDLYKDNNESKVTEVSRDAFNAKFQTITDSPTPDTKDNSYAKNEVNEDLVYEYVGEENGVERSKLITTDKDGNVLDNYKMTAKSEKYLRDVADWKETWTNDGKIEKNHYAIDVNCGLLKRYFDLAIGMDIESAKLTINDKETTYSYNQILDGALDKEITVEELLEKVQDNSELEYNLYLYSSDYNYRIDDYKMNAIENKVVEPEEGEKTDAQQIAENENDTSKELRAFVTYKVALMNQSTINSAQINELAYYYDENFNFISVGRAVDKTGIAINGEGINFDTNANLDSLEGKKSAKVTGFEQELKSPDYRQVLYFTFEIKKSDDETRTLPKDITCANIVEILSYSTDEGLIDNDSCPGNAAIAYGNAAIAYEDDTDEAPGLNIKVTKNGRTITGTVFEDLDKNGENNDNKPVNDVIVQLIEVKKINGKYYEYIWQETRSGSNGDEENLNVKATKANGYSGDYYTTDNSNGEYQFEGFIPGNYIIRFIYGDGRVYDITDSVETYNGQDYQSTKDPNYQSSWYNTAEYEAGQSVARDNEARRLKVMSYSITIDKDKWEEIEDKTPDMLQNTWMCAETSRINIQIDATDDDMKTEESITAVSFEYEDNSITYNDMNFGLIKRPETKLVLEKHITGLKITPTGTGVQPIVDARAKNISQILNNTEIETEGITTGLSTIKSNRNERGFWKVETDIEELAQGATLEVEYTYVIKNESDVDYLSEKLVDEYKVNINKDLDNNGKDDYVDYLTGAIRDAKSRTKGNTHLYGTYLGQFYYTGTPNEETDAPVLSRVDTVEDYLENQMKLASETNFRKSNPENVYKNMYDTDGKFVENGLNIETVIQNKEKFEFLSAKANEEEYKDGNTDYTKTVSLTTTLSASNKEITYPGYLAQIMQYSNAAGRRDMDACPGNLNYIHSEDNEMTLDSYVKYDGSKNVIEIYAGEGGAEEAKTLGYVRINEDDEYWGCGGEKIMVTKPTGEDKQAPLQIAIIAISSIAVLGVGIVLIKKFVLKK